jgi:TAT (twin-arginine translocation) pathway signal sequence./Xylose isomerase-like TIM barrel.
MYNRRQFIKHSAAVSAGAFAMPLLAHSKNKSKVSKIGVQVWSIAKFLEKDFKGSLKMLADLGYDELELYGPYPFSSEKDKASWGSMTGMLGFSQSGYFNHTAKEFKSILDSYGLKTPAMHIGLDTLRTKLEKTAEAAHILGQQYAGIAAIPEEERKTLDDYKRIADDFNSIGEKAKSLGIRFYYHNHGYGLKAIDGIIPFDLILERTDPSLVFFEMDIFWTTAGGADPIKYLDANPGRFKLMHVKDMKEQVQFSGDGGNPEQWVELFPYITDAGSGVLDLETILAHAKKSGMEHFIIENDVITDPKTSLKNSYQYLSSIQLPN